MNLFDYKKVLAVFILSMMLQPVSVSFSQEDFSSSVRVTKGAVPELKIKDQSLYADFVDNQLFERMEKAVMPSRIVKKLLMQERKAYNVNAFGNVPDSTFFTNRNEKHPLSVDEIKTGANVNSGPDMSGKWTVFKGKADGDNFGFFIKDANGDKYLIKLDRKSYPEMNSGAEVVTSKIFHAIGYNVPQYTVSLFPEDILTVADDAKYYNKDGFKKPLTRDLLIELCREVGFRNKDGKYRASASLFVEGDPIGYFSFNSSRSVDVNDVVRHEDRREVRGLRVFSSWMNHHDMRRGNTMDVIVKKEGGWFIKHYLIDFGASLGSHNFSYKYPEAGHMYVVDWAESLKALFSLGLYPRPYHVERQLISPSIGYFTAEHFEPKKWRPIFPNYAFDAMTDEDAYWAAKIVMSFTDDQIRAVVSTGEYSFEADRDYLSEVLIQRRDAIGEYWFRTVLPIDNFNVQVSDSYCQIDFENLYVKYGFGEGTGYQVRIYDTVEGKKAALIKDMTIGGETIKLDKGLNKSGLFLSITAPHTHSGWKEPVCLYLDEQYRLKRVQR